nr:MAG TPA: hypothetical protein [Caudoviricetes sp.]
MQDQRRGDRACRLHHRRFAMSGPVHCRKEERACG